MLWNDELVVSFRCGGCGCGCECLSYSLNCCSRGAIPAIVEDNCCHCNYAALKQMSGLTDNDIVYVTYHVDVGTAAYHITY